MSFLSKIFGDAHSRYLSDTQPVIEEINSLEQKFEAFSGSEIKDKTLSLKDRLSRGEEEEEVLPEAFALVREVSKRVLQQRHYDEQLMGGIAMHEGKVAEMKTGEGKTLAATLPAYLNSLGGGSVHIATVNDYLARRDTVWMGQIYHGLGIDTACLNHEQAFLYNPDYKQPDEEKDKVRDKLGGFKIVQDYLEPVSRKEAYKADVVYATNNEFGFDYLRDNMARRLEDKVQRGFEFAILDEIDFLLIDEARTPLIISSPDRTPSQLYTEFSDLVRKLEASKHYEVDEEKKSASLTQEGIDKVENLLGKDNIYLVEGGIDHLHHLEQALRAQAVNPEDGKPLFAKDRDYVVREGEVIIVDEFTGRLMPGRRWSGGLHQAIEAKEGVEVQPESKTMAKITFQNLFRMYDKLAGMTGTAVTSAEEFDKVYNLDVVCIPTHREDVREDLRDLVFKTKEAKYRAMIEDIKERHQRGQPLLIGTRSIEKNELVLRLLEKEGLEPAVLNAKNHEKEGEIIAQAGRLGGLTVATNMAGRGVDIVLGGNPPDKEEQDKVKKLGGLHVVGTERHEARRIDDQLRGRSGRQGDPGSSQFFLSLEDELIRVFGGEKIKGLMERFNFPEDEPIEAPMVSKAIRSAQKKVEGAHFDARKHLLEYDNVLNEHRKAFYRRRGRVLRMSPDEVLEEAQNLCDQEGLECETQRLNGAALRGFYLQLMDIYWMRHLEDMEWLKESVRLRAYANLDPLVEYKKEGMELFLQAEKEVKSAFAHSVADLSSKEPQDLTSKVGRRILEGGAA